MKALLKQHGEIVIDVVPCGGSHSTTGTNSRCKDPEKDQAGPGRALVREPGIKGGPGGKNPGKTRKRDRAQWPVNPLLHVFARDTVPWNMLS